MLYIAENIKALRKNLDMTQEEVAAIIGVSPQSVSKWERGDTYPDITLLPSLANLYKVSVDALIGMDKINAAQARTAIFIKGQKCLREGDNSGAATVFEEALKLYPNDEYIMLELALVFAFDDEPSNLNRAAQLFQRILSNNPVESVQYTARAALCYIFLKTGEKDKAIDAAQKLPHSRVSRECILEKIEEDPDIDEINACLSFITFRDNADHDILVIDFGLNFVSSISEDKWLDRIRSLRDEIGKNKAGRYLLPAVRVRDNEELPNNRVRVRYYTDYLLDKEFTDPAAAIDEVIIALRTVAGV